MPEMERSVFENHFDLLRDVWYLLRDFLLDPIEILPYIKGLSDNDIEGIKAAMSRNKIEAIDQLYYSLRRRDIDCFRSFLSALRICEYGEVAKKIMEIGGIDEQFLGIDTTLTLPNSEECVQRDHKNTAVHGSQANFSSLESSSSPSQTQTSKNPANPCSRGDEPLSRKTKLGNVLNKKFKRWVDELNRDMLWEQLCDELSFERNEVKNISKSNNPGEKLLDQLTEWNFSVERLLTYLEGQKFFNLRQLILEDLGEMDYKTLGNSSSQDVNNRNSGAFENVVLGIPTRNDAANNLSEKIENKPTNSCQQNLDISSTSRPPNGSNFTASLESRKSESCRSIDKIIITEDNMAYSQNSSFQKEDQLAKVPRSTETISKQPTESCDTSLLVKKPQLEKETRSSETMSKETLESDDISPMIKQSQKEIALENKKKGLEEPYNDTSQMADVNVSEQTSLKSQFSDDNLNIPENLELREPKTGPENAPRNPNEFSFLSNGKEDDENKGPSIQHGLHIDGERSHELDVSEEQGDSNHKGSSQLEGIEDLENELNQVNFQQKSISPRLPGNFINIPVQDTGAREVSGSSWYFTNLSNHLTDTDLGNLMAAPESLEPPPCSQYNLIESGNENRSTAVNVMASQQLHNSNTTPISVIDDSDTKNIEMEADALREDVINQTCPDFRDIQNSIPEPRGSNEEDRDNQPSLVNQFCYSAETEATRRSQGQTNISNVPSDPTGI